LRRWGNELKEEVAEVSFVEGDAKLATRLFAEVAADLHLRCKGDDRNADFGFDTGIERFMNVAGVTGGQGPKDNDYFTRGVGGQMTGRSTYR